MIVKLKEAYESKDENLVKVVKDFFELVKHTDVTNKYQVETVNRISNELGDVYGRMVGVGSLIVPAISTRDTVVLYELDYLRDSSVYYVKEAICENNDGTITHFDVDILSNL